MKRAAPALVLIVSAALFSVAAEKDAGTGYELENVQVLDKSMRLADARRYMVTFNTALGVQCRDCHDLRDFASDEHELKLVARDMMRMTREINATWFPEADGEAVTCFTCHQGRRDPLRDEAAAGDLVPTDGD